MEGNGDGFGWMMYGESYNCATISTPSAGNPSGWVGKIFLHGTKLCQRNFKRPIDGILQNLLYIFNISFINTTL